MTIEMHQHLSDKVYESYIINLINIEFIVIIVIIAVICVWLYRHTSKTGNSGYYIILDHL